jgi:ribA/ribD-fused uncharacterized protein
MSKDAVIKKNLEFIYSRTVPENQLPDPDKVRFVRSNQIKDKAYDTESAVFDFFGQHECFAPAYPAIVYLPGEEVFFPSFEHALQASKCIDIAAHAATIRSLIDVKELKRYISKLKSTNSLILDWNNRCLGVAETLLRDKFMRHKKMKIVLMKTGHKHLIYKNTYNDLFWGCNEGGEGQNHLGKLLEKIRCEIDEEKDLARWISSFHLLLSSEDARVHVFVLKDGVQVSEGSKLIDEKNVITIGKADSNDIVASHPSLSRLHAVVALTTSGPLLVDLDSANGTCLAGVKLVPFKFTPLPQQDDMVEPRGADRVTFGGSHREYIFIIRAHASQLRQQELLDRVHSASNEEASSRNTIFIRNLPLDTTPEDLTVFFAPCGAITTLSVPVDRKTGVGRGIAFITFDSFGGLMQAVSRDGDEFRGKCLKIKRSSEGGKGSRPQMAAEGQRGGKRRYDASQGAGAEAEEEDGAKYGLGRCDGVGAQQRRRQ